MASILTNTNSMAALQTLRSISSNMETTQSRISTGQKVSSAADNAAYWSIATTMRSDKSALGAVSDALGLGAAKVDTAYTAMESTISVVSSIKDKLIAAMEPTADKAKIQKEISQLQKQLQSVADSASFSGENWLKAKISDGAGAAVSAAELTALTKQVVASFTRDSSGVKIQTADITLSASNVLYDTGSTADNGKAKGILDTSVVADMAKGSVATIDISDMSVYKGATGKVVLADASDNDVLQKLVSHVDKQLKSLTSAASDLGAMSKRISMQDDFVSKLSDAMDKGISKLVDADMNEESTRLKALQTQQQLAIQALSIANNDSQSILSLFR